MLTFTLKTTYKNLTKEQNIFRFPCERRTTKYK